MSKNLEYVLYLLGAFLLIASYFFIFNTSDNPSNTSSQKQLLSDSSSLSPSNELTHIQQELERIIEAGGHINPQRYDEINQQITEAMEEGVEQEEEKYTLSLLSQLKVDGKESKSEEKVVTKPNPVSESKPNPVVYESDNSDNSDNYYNPDPPYIQNQEEVPQNIVANEYAPKVEIQEQRYNIEQETQHLSYIGHLPQPSPSCEKNRNPVFTHHITDVSRISYVAPPPTIGKGSGGNPQLKTHSYIGTDSDRAPVYAPVDMVLDNGAHYTGGPYWFGFEVSCEIRLRLAHITEPVQKIKEVFPAKPNVSSEDHKPKYKVSLKAGELIGYTSGTNGVGNWDFGVYDLLSRNRYAKNSENGWVFSTAVCPYDYFPEEMRSAYANNFNEHILEGNPLDGESFCK